MLGVPGRWVWAPGTVALLRRRGRAVYNSRGDLVIWNGTTCSIQALWVRPFGKQRKDTHEQAYHLMKRNGAEQDAPGLPSCRLHDRGESMIYILASLFLGV